MKCPKCGYHSFDHLDNCRKCHQALADHKARFNLCGFFSPDRTVAESAFAAMASHDEDEPACGRPVDFGFDFLDEEPEQLGTPAGSSFDGGQTRTVAINQPFAADSETIPAGELAVNLTASRPKALNSLFNTPDRPDHTCSFACLGQTG